MEKSDIEKAREVKLKIANEFTSTVIKYPKLASLLPDDIDTLVSKDLLMNSKDIDGPLFTQTSDAEIFLVTHPKFSDKIFQKRFTLSTKQLNEFTFSRVKHEIEIMYKCNHPGIIPLKGLLFTQLSPKSNDFQISLFYPHKLGHISDLYENRVPRKRLKKKVSNFQENQGSVHEVKEKVFTDLQSYLRSYLTNNFYKMKLIFGICCALHYLHSNGIIHYNLNSSTILIDNFGNPLISDFSFSDPNRFPNDIKPSNLYFQPPESLLSSSNEEKITKASDIFSLGIIINSILRNRSPWDKDFSDNDFSHYLSNPNIRPKLFSENEDNTQLGNNCDTFGIPKEIIENNSALKLKILKTKEFYEDLIKGCLETDSTKRKSISEIVSSLFSEESILPNIPEDDFEQTIFEYKKQNKEKFPYLEENIGSLEQYQLYQVKVCDPKLIPAN